MNRRTSFLAFLVLAGCSGASDSDTSAGQKVGTLSEEMRISGHTQELVPIIGVAIGSNDELVLGQPQESRVRYFDSTGEPVGSFGGPGEGPGEFMGLSNIGFIADTLWIWDQNLSRMTLVTPGRELVRTFVLNRPLRSVPPEFTSLVDWVFPFARALHPNDELTVEFSVPVGFALPEPYENHLVLGKVTAAGDVLDLVASIRHGGQVGISTGRGGVYVPALFRNGAYVDISDDTERIIGAATSLVGNQADSIAVTMWSAGGHEIWSRSYPFTPVPLDPAEVDSVFAGFQEFPPQFQEALNRELLIPPVRPPLTGVTIGRDGTVWIEMVEDETGRPYLVLDPTGEPIGSLLLPARSRIAIGDLDRIWVIERDEVDVESVVRYSVTWD